MESARLKLSTRSRHSNSSALTLAYRHRNNEQVQKWIVQPALAANAGAPVKLEKGSAQISFRALEGAGQAFAVLSNWGQAENVVVSFAGEAGFGVRSQQLPLSPRAAAITRRHFDSEKAVAAATALQSASRRVKP
jgi:hypothetical protein